MNPSEFSCVAGYQLAVSAAKAGWELEDFGALSRNEEMCRKFLAYVRGHAMIKILEYPIDCSVPVSAIEDLIALPDNEQPQNRIKGVLKFEPEQVGLHVSDRREGSANAGGHIIRKELAKEQLYTAHVLDYLLKPENQHLILEKWRGRAIFFWGTLYLSVSGHLCVRYLSRSFWGRWHSGYRRLDFAWDDSMAAAVSKPIPKAQAAKP